MSFVHAPLTRRELPIVLLACVLALLVLGARPDTASAAAPRLLGPAVEGATVRATAATTSRARLTWMRCNANATRCTRIFRATRATYRATAADIGFRLRLDARRGRRLVRTQPTRIVTPMVPRASTAPAITGSATPGATLTASPGRWLPAGRAVRTSYQWSRCAGGRCTKITGATNTSYVVDAASDANASLRVDVLAVATVRRQRATGRASSTQTAPVAVAVTQAAAPAITGSAVEGATLTAAPGTWTSHGLAVDTSIAWTRCRATCDPIAGATGATYVASAADVGARLRADITARSAVATSTASSAETAIVTPVAPVSSSTQTLAPTTGIVVGNAVASNAGIWTTYDPTTYAYQWQRCQGSACTSIPGATSAPYVPTNADIAHGLRTIVTADHLGASATTTSATTGLVAGAPPRSVASPALSGTPTATLTLGSTEGAFVGSGLITVTRQWLRCDATGAACVDVGSPNAAMHLLGTPDIGSTMRVRSTATSVWGTTTATSAATSVVAAAEPTSASLPVVSPSVLRETSTATASTGTWRGLAPTGYAYQWLRCNSAGAACVDIDGATAQTRVLALEDVGARLRVRVTATNAAGSGSAESAPTAVVLEAPQPRNVTVPVLNGTSTHGSTYTLTGGAWSGLPVVTRTYTWHRCQSDGTGCVAITGATSSSYLTKQTEVGKRIFVRERVTNSAGEGTADSALSGVIQPVAPSNSALPTVSGTAKDGLTLGSTTGTWSGSTTITYARAWMRCNADGNECTLIPSATGSNYVVKTADIGSKLRLRVTASNGVGSVSVLSNPTAVVAGSAPIVLGAPAISGTLAVGEDLQATTGVWGGLAPTSYAYAWSRCGTNGVCTAITGATTANYTLVALDEGARLRVTVTATNSIGSTPSQSLQTGVVASEPVAPSVLAPPTISGQPLQGLLLTATGASFTGTPNITHAYSWQRCTAGDMTTCQPIPDAIAGTYRTTLDDVGMVVRVLVVGENGAGSAEATSEPTAAIIATYPPENDVAVPPTIEGDMWEHGQDVQIHRGTWTGTATITYAYQWQRCDANGDDCVDLPAARSLSYELTELDVGYRMRGQVTATNQFGIVSATTQVSSIVAVARPPVNSGDLPRIVLHPTTPVPEQSRIVSADRGDWTGSPMIYRYQWLRCDDVGLECVEIAGKTSTNYTPDVLDVGSTLRVRVTAVNAAAPLGEVAYSAESAVVVAARPPVQSKPVVMIVGENRTTFEVDVESSWWTGTTPIAVKWQWQRCTSEDPTSCSDLGEPTTSRVYDLTGEDIGYYMRVVSTATNVVALDPVRSTPSNILGPVSEAGAPELLDQLPSISGDLEETRPLTADPGTWSGIGPLVFTYAWLRCNELGDACDAIAGAEGEIYTLTAADVGSTLRVIVVASNPVGSSLPATSEPTGVVVAGSAPDNTTPPTVTGANAVVGTKLTGTAGTWTGTADITHALTWHRCEANGTGCVAIPLATATTYTLVNADAGKQVRLKVRATNTFGNDEAWSSGYPTPTGVIEPAVLPVAEVAPVVTNETIGNTQPRAGHELSTSRGTWTGTPTITYTYQWLRCDGAGDACVEIAGATDNDYVTTLDDIGATLRGRVRAINPGAVAVFAMTEPTEPVLAADPPVNTSPPSVTAAPERTQPASSTNGAWSGSAPMVLTRVWQRCSTTDASSCADITTATGVTYTPVSLDVGSYLRVVVTATNGAGPGLSASAISAMSLQPVSAGTAPTTSGTPQVAGSLQVGAVHTANPGPWSGTGTISFSYQWQRCSADGLTCHDVAGASSSTYTPIASDAGKRIRVLVRGHNTIGVSGQAASPAVGPIS